jgi:hypothetical protein
MRFSRVFHQMRILMGVGLFGLIVLVAGCDGGGADGTSSVAPATPPPGKSAADQAAARAAANTAPGKNAAKKVEAPAKSN